MSDPFKPPSEASISDLYGADAGSLSLEQAKASRGARFVAAVIDNAIVIVPIFPVGMLVSILDDTSAEPLGEAALALPIYGTVFLLSLINWVLIVMRGQTVGKLAVGIRIVTETGRPVNFVNGVILRNWVLSIFGGFCGIIGLVDALMIFNDERQCLHDKIAKTIVVDALAYDPYRPV